MSADRKPKVVVADYDYGDVDIERSIVNGAGFEFVAGQSKSEDDVIASKDRQPRRARKQAFLIPAQVLQFN